MVISYVTRSPVSQLAGTGTIAAVIYDSLNWVVDHPMAATIWQTRTKVTDLSFAVTDEKITNSTPTSQDSLLSLPVKIKQGPALRPKNPLADNLETKPALSQD